MSNISYYKEVSDRNDNLTVMKFYNNSGGGILYDLVSLKSRELKAGEEFKKVFEINEKEYEALVKTFYIKLGDKLSRGVGLEGDYSVLDIDFSQVESDSTDEKFEPKTSFLLMHKDIKMSGFSKRTTEELIQFILDLKKNNGDMLVLDIDGDIIGMINSQSLKESSFEFIKI